MDVLVAGPDEPRRRWSRGAVTAVAAVAVLAAGAAAAVELRDERRLGSVVALSLSPEVSASGAYDRQGGRVVLELLLQVRNDGPRPVTILRGGVADYGLAREVEVAAGERALLPLGRTVDCSPPPPIPSPAGTLELSVRPGQAGPRQVALPLPSPFTDEQALLVCGVGG